MAILLKILCWPLKHHHIVFWLLGFVGFQKLPLFTRKPYVFPNRRGACQDGTLRQVSCMILRLVFCKLQNNLVFIDLKSDMGKI